MTASPPTPRASPLPTAPRRKRRHRHHHSSGEKLSLGPNWGVALILALLATSVAVACLFYGSHILKWLAWPFGDG